MFTDGNFQRASPRLSFSNFKSRWESSRLSSSQKGVYLGTFSIRTTLPKSCKMISRDQRSFPIWKSGRNVRFLLFPLCHLHLTDFAAAEYIISRQPIYDAINKNCQTLVVNVALAIITEPTDGLRKRAEIDKKLKNPQRVEILKEIDRPLLRLQVQTVAIVTGLFMGLQAVGKQVARG